MSFIFPSRIVHFFAILVIVGTSYFPLCNGGFSPTLRYQSTIKEHNILTPREYRSPQLTPKLGFVWERFTSTGDNEETVLSLSSVLEDEQFHLPEETKKTKKKKTNTEKKKKSTPKRSKADIKTMKFLMHQDVEKLIEANDQSAAQVAEDNIQRLELLYETEGVEDYKPRIITYNVLVRAYGKSQRDDAPALAEQTLQRIISVYKQTGDEDMKPTVVTFTEVIDAYARSKKKNAAEQAERILLEMMEGSKYGNDIPLPTSITCDVVINAWAKRRTREGAQRAERILERMEYFRTMGNSEIQPSTYSFATVISAWANSGAKTEAAERSEYILQRMIKFKQKVENSEDDSEYAKLLSPDTVVYNSVIDAWAKSYDPRAGTKAEGLLKQMEEQYENGDKNLAPDSITYNTVINCHANSKHVSAAKSAEKILKKMEMAATIAAELSENERKRVAPNTRTYNQVLKCYASIKIPGAPQRAQAILKYMLVSKQEDIQPDVISFCTCLDVWAKSNEKGKAEQSYALLEKLIELYKASGNQKLKPTVLIYNTVFNCCAFSAHTEAEERKKAISIAIKLFHEMIQANITPPDAVTYGTLIKCISNLVPFGEVRNKMASDIFSKCANSGLVNGLVFDEIRRAVPGKVLAQLLHEPMRPSMQRKSFKEWELKHLPRSWKGKKQQKCLALSFFHNFSISFYLANVVERKPKKKSSTTWKISTAPNKDETQDKPTPVPIRPLRRIRPEISWQSGKDL